MKSVQKQTRDQAQWKSIYIDGVLHRTAKIHCAENGRSIREFVEEAIQAKLQEERDAA